jgi:hypothetical protein
MRTFRMLLAALVAAAAPGLSLGAEQKQGPKGGGNTAFGKIRALSGEWEVTRGPSEHDRGGTITYKVTSGGSTVLETVFPGTEHEMVTLYYMDGDDLSLTHYCMLHNRPRMRAERGSSADKIVFRCQDGDDPKHLPEDHMHQVTFTFVDANHIKTEWVLYKGGKPDSTHAVELVRKDKK